MLDAGIICKSMSPWASPVVVVKKHTPQGSPQQFHLCIDYRKLNTSITPARGTEKGTFALVSLPKIDELPALLKAEKYFTALNLHCGYYHIRLDEESIPKSTFKTVFDKFDFSRLPLACHKAQTSSFLSSMTFLDLTRPLIKVMAKDI